MSRPPRFRPPLYLPTGARVPLPVDPASSVLEWVGAHTLVAIVIGFALPPVVAFAIGVFSFGGDAEYSAEVAKAAFPEVYRLHYEQTADETRARIFVASVNGDSSLTEPWARGVRDGWRVGWFDAIDAMRAALATTEWHENAYEHQILDEVRTQDRR